MELSLQNTLREKRQNSQSIVRDWLEKSSRHMAPVCKKVQRADEKENKRPRPSMWSEAGKLTSFTITAVLLKGAQDALATPTR